MGCTSRTQNLKFRAQNFDLHRSDPQRSGTPEKYCSAIFADQISEGEKPPKIRKKKLPGTKFLGTFGPPPTEKTEKIGKIKGTLVRKVPGNLRSQEFVFFLVRLFCPLKLSNVNSAQELI